MEKKREDPPRILPQVLVSPRGLDECPGPSRAMGRLYKQCMSSNCLDTARVILFCSSCWGIWVRKMDTIQHLLMLPIPCPPMPDLSIPTLVPTFPHPLQTPSLPTWQNLQLLVWGLWPSCPFAWPSHGYKAYYGDFATVCTSKTHVGAIKGYKWSWNYVFHLYYSQNISFNPATFQIVRHCIKEGDVLS